MDFNSGHRFLAYALHIRTKKSYIRRAIKEGFTGRWIAFMVLALGVLFIVYLASKSDEIEAADWAQIMLMLCLVTVTGVYALSAVRQANASVKMAEEMREQRLMASRPLMIQKFIPKRRFLSLTNDNAISQEVMRSKYFSHFEIYNAGNGPAIELTIAIVTEEKDSYLEARRETYMRAGDTPIEFRPSNLEGVAESKTYYLVSEYQGILSRTGKEPWYQTWLPFKVDKASKEGEVYVTAGELEFKEVTEKDRIDNFVKWSRPK